MFNGYIQLNRCEEVEQLLLKEPEAYLLLNLIAYRARRTASFNPHNLQPGEALIGDDGSCGLTSRNYRTAKEKLTRWHFATFKATNKGTIAKLADNRLWNINADIVVKQNDKQNDSRPTSKRQAADKQPTTNKEREECNNLDIYLEAPGAVDSGALTRRFFGLDEKTGTFIGISQKDIDGWKKTYEYLNPSDYFEEMAKWILKHKEPEYYLADIPRKFFTNWLSKHNLINQTNSKKGQKNDRSNDSQRQGTQVQGRFINGKRDDSPLVAGAGFYN